MVELTNWRKKDTITDRIVKTISLRDKSIKFEKKMFIIQLNKCH